MFQNIKVNKKKNNVFYRCLFFASVTLVLSGALTHAATYYVSEQGNDANPGTQSSPWRNINYAASKANPGDTVLVRGGTYYEEVRTYRSGTAANRITFKAYPNETPIVDGTAPVSGWQKCTSSTDFVDHSGNSIAGKFPGNTSYQNIYKATIPASEVGYGSSIHVFEDGRYLMRSGMPKQLPDNYIYDNIDQYQNVDPACYGQRNYIIDKNRNEPDGYWVGARIYVYLYNNNHHVASSTVVGWNRAENKFTLSPALPANLTSGGTIADCYKLENHWGALTQPGEAYHTTNANNNTYTVYVWPRNPADITSNKIRVSKHDRGFEFVNNYDDYITVDGFTFRGFTSGPNSGTHGSFGIGNISAYPHTGVEIKNNTVLNCAGTAAITMWCGTNDVYENNIIDGCRTGYGIAVRGLSTASPTDRCKIRGNTINRIRSTSIKVIYSNNLEITRNKVGKSGSHGNACSLYMNNNNVLFAHNITTESNSGLTMQDSSNIYIIGNALQATADNVCAAWANSKDTMRGDVFILGNTIQRGADKKTGGAVGFSTDGYQAKYVVINNIIDGAMYAEDVLNVTRRYNLYTDYSWRQASKYGWALATGELYNDDYTAIFNDPANYDYSIKAGSIADNKGTDISAYLPTDKFPDYDFSVDLFGTPRGTPSLGACEGGSKSGTDPIKIDPPVANAGSDQTVAYENRANIRLDGSKSTGHGTLTYIWTINGDLAKVGATPIISLEPGTHTALLTVKDGQTPAAESTDTATIVVLDAESGGLTLRDGLVGEWKFSENVGTAAADSSGKANTATLSDESMWDSEGSIDFKSTQTYLTCQPDESLNLTGSLTLSAWIYPRSFGGGNYGRIFDKGDGPSGRGFSLMLDGTNGNLGYMAYGSTYASSDNNVLELDTWTHICVTFDRQGQTVAFYVNGQQAGSSPYTQSPADNAGDPLLIGLRGYDKNRNFDGAMNRVTLHNRALNVDEVQQLFVASNDDSDKDLTGLWRLDDYAGNLAKDASANENTAVLLDAPEWGMPWKDTMDECLYFNGTTQAMEISTQALTAEGGTVVLKAQPFSTSGLRFLFGHVNNATDKNLIWLYTVSGKLSLGIGNNATLVTGLDTLGTGTMYQIALAWDGTDYYVYVDGQLVGSGAYSGLTALAQTADIANMGTVYHRTNQLGFDGIIDDVRTYNRPLSAQEIANLATLQETTENKCLEFYVNGFDENGNPLTYTSKSLPAGADFDVAAQKLCWRPWYNRAGNHQILFTTQDGTEEQAVKVAVREVQTRDWYRNFLTRNGKL